LKNVFLFLSALSNEAVNLEKIEIQEELEEIKDIYIARNPFVHKKETYRVER